MASSNDPLLEKFYQDAGSAAEPGTFTLSPKLIKQKLGSIFVEHPEVVIAQFLRSLHLLSPVRLGISTGDTLVLTAAGLRPAVESQVLGPDSKTFSNLLLFLQASPYAGWELAFAHPEYSWERGEESLPQIPLEKQESLLRLRLKLPPDGHWEAELAYLRKTASWLSYPCLVDGDLLGLEEEESFAMGRFGCAKVPAFLADLSCRVRQGGALGTIGPEGKARTAFYLEDGEAPLPVLVEINARKGPTTVRFFSGGALTKPETVGSLGRFGLQSEITVYAPEAALDTTGLRLLENEDKNLALEAAGQGARETWKALDSTVEFAIRRNSNAMTCISAIARLLLSFFLPLVLTAALLVPLFQSHKSGDSPLPTLVVILLFFASGALCLGSLYVFNFWAGAPWIKRKKREDVLQWLQFQYVSLTNSIDSTEARS